MKNKSLIFILLLTLFSSLTFSMAHPVTPMLIKSLGLPSFMFGVLFAAMSIGNFIGSPLWGTLSDNKGRIKFLILGALGYGLSQLGFGYVTNPLIILLFRFTGGFFVVSYLTTSMAYVSDVTTKETRVKYVTYYAASNTIGSALGSLLGGIIGNNNYKTTFLVQFIFCIILSVLVYLLLNETITPSKEKIQLKRKKSNTNTSFVNKSLIPIFAVIILFFFTSTSYNSTINYYIEDVLKLSSTFIGAFLAIAGIVGFTVNLFFTPLLTKYFKEINVFKIITLLLSLALLLMVYCNNLTIFFCAAILFASLASMHIPLQQTLITKLSNGNYGSLMGILNSCKAIGMVAGSLSAGFIFELGNKLPFFISAIIIATGLIILALSTKKSLLNKIKSY